MAPSTSIEIPDGCIIPQGLTIYHWSWKPSLRLRWLIIPPSPRLFAMFGQSFTALQLFGSRLRAQGETSLPPLPPYLSTLSFFSGQQVQVWMAKTIEEEEGEVLAEWISPGHLFLAETLLSPTNFFGISFGYPFRPK